MSLTVERHNYATGQAERVPVNESVLQRFIDRFFVERLGRPPGWLADPERMYRDLFIPTMRELTVSDARPVAAPADWRKRVLDLRFPAEGQPMSWREIAKAVNKPLSTVRRVAAEASVPAG